ncbi:MAG TPA: NAD(P)/FAD-dependent oxidoreductase [Trueperaceae bacterium]|nr:NAD(P)/FAD-dependent oxidoreductase [Trueperaceae bacterium]
MKNQHQILIIGGGTAGITTAARLRNAMPQSDIAIIEPSEKHYYQPLWTLVGGGIMKKEVTQKDEVKYIPKNVKWIKDYAEDIDPDASTVSLRNGDVIGYEYLIIAPGIQLDWDKVKGLKESIGKNGVCSNYSYQTVDSTWKALREFKGGNAVFTNPLGQIKCGGAPQKIMYLAEHYLRKNGLKDKSKVIGAFAGTVMLGVPEINEVLNGIVKKRNIDMRFYHNLVEVKGDEKIAVFDVRDAKTGEVIKQEEIEFNMLHATPPQSSPDFLKKNAKLVLPDGPHVGFVDVDKYTLQHNSYKNIFSLGDSAALPTAKTGAAVRKQAPVLVQNLKDLMAGNAPSKKYDGYSSCPLVTGYNSLVLAEFLYDNKYKPTFPINQAKERYDMFLLKRYILPILYWQFMLRGKA